VPVLLPVKVPPWTLAVVTAPVPTVSTVPARWVIVVAAQRSSVSPPAVSSVVSVTPSPTKTSASEATLVA